MSQSAALSILSPRGQPDQATDQPASLQTQSQEDLHLAGCVERAMHATGYLPLCNIEVAVQTRVATLQGRVPSYYLKQVAQIAAQSIPGIHEIQNDIEVAKPSLQQEIAPCDTSTARRLMKHL